jgi:hypothetical protein
MAEYRCYHIDLRGHIVAFEVFHRANDSEAIGHARRIASEKRWYAHELWRRGRKLSASPRSGLVWLIPNTG